MALELKQSLRLSQQLVMTPQLQQAIKLLQLSRLELVDLIRSEMEQNPLLEEPQEGAETELNEAPPERVSPRLSATFSSRNSASSASARASRSGRETPSASSTAVRFWRTVSLRKIDASCGR